MTNLDAHNATHDAPPAADGRAAGVRQLIEAAVCLALAVILFRGFQVEGYMISTGSMAPALLGFHKRVVCPSCHFSFAVGDVVDAADSRHSVADDDGGARRGPDHSRGNLAVCPNCGQGPIDISSVPRSQGDQLLVHKHAFQFCPPRRWEVGVFRNPYKPTQAYVKRIVGLPGESIQIIDGDVYVDGDICRKNLATQRTMRILVFDKAYQPEDERWQARWTAESARVPWNPTSDGFHLHGDDRDQTGAAMPDLAWVTYRHWTRSPRRGTPAELSPVTDVYGYNAPGDAPGEFSIRDLMFSALVTIRHGEGEFVVQMTDGEQSVRCVIDPTRQEIQLLSDRVDGPAIRRAVLSPEMFQAGRAFHLEVSLIDRQALVAIDGELPFEPWPLPGRRSAAAAKRPVQFGARGLSTSVSQLRLFRDIYYTRGKGLNAVEEPCQLRENEYFVLGDNSPVSLDGRSWPDGALDGRLFIGKPFLVHLPSKPGKVRLGEHDAYFRIPDFSQIRTIH